MKTAIVYPYSLLSAPVVRHLVWKDDIIITAAVIPGRWCPENADASYVDENEYIGVPIKHSFEDALKNCNTVIWTEYDYCDDDCPKEVRQNIIKALLEHKNVICCTKLTDAEISEFTDIAFLGETVFDYIPVHAEKKILPNVSKDRIRVPIVAVMGVSNNCLKFETQLFLRRHFIDEGYKISQIGSRSGCEILGFHSFPDFMYENISEKEKTDVFLSYVTEIQNNENPDVIIIGIPGGIYPLSLDHTFNYGITAYEVCNAIQVDCTVLNVWCDSCSEKLLENMKNVLKYRYNSELDCVCLSNISVNKSDLMDKGHILGYNIYSSTESEEYDNIQDKTGIYSMTGEAGEKLFEGVLKTLA